LRLSRLDGQLAFVQSHRMYCPTFVRDAWRGVRRGRVERGGGGRWKPNWTKEGEREIEKWWWRVRECLR